MARGNRTIVPVDRLRDQVYRLILEDLKTGILEPGSRLVEGDLANAYNVSRTPVREALFQLAREGVLSPGDRGYVVAVDSTRTTIERHEVRELIDPRVASHAATEGSAAEKRALEKAHQRQCKAHESGSLAAFIRANVEFRAALRSMCSNQLLVRCSQLLDDQAQPSRRAVFRIPEYRALEIEHDGRVLEAIIKGDAKRADIEMRAYVETVRKNVVMILNDESLLADPKDEGETEKRVSSSS